MRRSLALAVIAGLGSVLLGSSLAMADSSTTSTSSTTTLPTTTTTAPKVPVAPLTGLPDPKRSTRNRSALTIKIDNTPQAMPHYGVQDADVVYEEIVEGGITRLAAIFNSHVPNVVGPVRSVRRTDREIVFPIGGIFAFSGGAEYALKSIATAPVKLYDQANAGRTMFRDPHRPPPHNLFANAELLMAKDGKPRPPPPLFSYLPAGKRPHGPKASSFVVNFENGFAATYHWDTRTRSWDRSLFGEPDVSANGVRISPKNVIVLTVNYVGGAGVIDSYAQLVGRGPVEVFSGGVVQHGTWSRSDLYHRAIYKNLAGTVINLNPGQTWVELLATGEGVSITS
ncbi:MAG: hypothetical protein JWM55_1742 [Acidimicrobiaceae bacterium]|nr:hypothetical protein [Acidimicrobiaceae bacterium]